MTKWDLFQDATFKSQCKKRGIKPPYDPAIPLLGIYPEETKILKAHVSHCSLQHYLQ